jgi:hypothetical protein
VADKKKSDKHSLKVKTLPKSSAQGAGSVKGGMRMSEPNPTTKETSTVCATTMKEGCC